MKLDKVANSQNDEFYTPVYAISPILKRAYKGHKEARLAWNTRAPILSSEEVEMLEGME